MIQAANNREATAPTRRRFPRMLLIVPPLIPCVIVLAMYVLALQGIQAIEVVSGPTIYIAALLSTLAALVIGIPVVIYSCILLAGHRELRTVGNWVALIVALVSLFVLVTWPKWIASL